MNDPCLLKDEGWRELITEVARVEEIEGLGDIVVLEEGRSVQREGKKGITKRTYTVASQWSPICMRIIGSIRLHRIVQRHTKSFVAVCQTPYTGH